MTTLQRTVAPPRPRAALYRVAVLGVLLGMGLAFGVSWLASAIQRRAARVATSPTARVRDAVVDVSRSARFETVRSALGLRPGDRITAIDDHATNGADDFADAWQLAAPGDFIDVTVEDARGVPFRTLVLVHR